MTDVAIPEARRRRAAATVVLRSAAVVTAAVAATVVAAALHGIGADEAFELGGIAFAAGAVVLMLGLASFRLDSGDGARALRLRSVVVAVIPVLAVFAGSYVAGRAMFVSEHYLQALVIIVIGSGTAGVLGALALADRLVAARAAVADAQARQSDLEQSRRELVAWVSHDLRTPIAGMRAMAEALADEVVADPPSVARYHRNMLQEAERLGELVDELFELSALQVDAPEIRFERLALADLVSDAIATATPLAASIGISLDATVRTDAVVQAGPRELQRVVHNLVDNALRHTPAGGRVELAVDAAHGEAVLTVADGCGGIPPEDAARVFEPGFRSDPARRAGAGGGFGLTIARALVEAHGGRITLADRPGGCAFSVHLPLDAELGHSRRPVAEVSVTTPPHSTTAARGQTDT